MIPKMLVYAVFFAVGAELCSPIAGFADDSAASIAAGGLVARRETRIVMAKEVLQISPTKIIVDYDFRNDTDEDVTTEVAFPVPRYGYDPDGPLISDASFSGFKLTVDGKPVVYRTEAKATLKGKDVTAILTADKVDIPSIGHLREIEGPNHVMQVHTSDVEQLPKAEQQRLAKLGLVDPDDGWGEWDAHVQYHWTQTFPAHATVHIRHEYVPVAGFEEMPLDTLQDVLQHREPIGDKGSIKYQREDMQRLKGFCPEPSLLRGIITRLEASDPESGQFALPQWVDFILTSANTWKQPIEDFTLIVDRGKPDEGRSRFVSFCSPQNAPVAKLDADHFQVHLINFVPTSELHIGFFDVPDAKSSKK